MLYQRAIQRVVIIQTLSEGFSCLFYGHIVCVEVDGQDAKARRGPWLVKDCDGGLLFDVGCGLVEFEDVVCGVLGC